MQVSAIFLITLYFSSLTNTGYHLCNCVTASMSGSNVCTCLVAVTGFNLWGAVLAMGLVCTLYTVLVRY